MATKSGLGRGLAHLLDQNTIMEEVEKGNLYIQEIGITEIKPNPYQPRKNFDEQALNELAKSIKSQGIFQPILLNKSIIGYNIISGERRYRAAKIAGLTTVPSIIYNYNDMQMMEVALIENIQREDLSTVEEARSYAMIIENLNFTQQQLAEKIGKSRPHVANILRLLNLDDEVLDMVDDKKLTMGQIKPLIAIEDVEMQVKLAKEIIKKGLSSRQVEVLVKEMLTDDKKLVQIEDKTINIPRNKRLEQNIREKVGVKVSITGEEKGTLEFKFSSNEELEELLSILNLMDEEVN